MCSLFSTLWPDRGQHRKTLTEGRLQLDALLAVLGRKRRTESGSFLSRRSPQLTQPLDHKPSCSPRAITERSPFVLVLLLLIFGCTGFSLLRLLFSQSTGSKARGLSSCGFWALGHRLSGCGALAEALCSVWGLLGQGLTPQLLLWQAVSLPLSHQGSPLFYF